VLSSAPIVIDQSPGAIRLGMFDDIKCDATLPDSRIVPGSWFQTKSLACSMYRYSITDDGRLVYHQHRYQYGPEQLIKGRCALPTYEPVGDIEMDYHGDIRFYAEATDKTWAEYVARFTNGKLESIRPIEELTETHRTWLMFPH
jgi:hypothetical protein